MSMDHKQSISKRHEGKPRRRATRRPDEMQLGAARLLLEIARGTGAEWGAWIRHLCQFEAEVLQVERVSFWSIDEQASCMVCDGGYVTTRRTFEHGARILASQAPEYFKAVRASRMLEMKDVYQDPRARGMGDYCAARDISSKLDIPVWAGGRLSGVLCHEHVGSTGSRRSWSAAQEEFAVAVGQVIASGLVARAHTSAEAAAQRAAFLDATTRLVFSSLDVHEIANQAVTLAVPRLADIAALWLLDRNEALGCIAAKHVDPARQSILDDVTHGLVKIGEAPAFATRVVRQGQSLLLPDTSAEDLDRQGIGEGQRAGLEQLNISSVIGAPLVAAGRTIGAMVLNATGRHYESDDRELVEDIASRVGAALEHARLYGIAGEAIRVRDDFFVLMAHELRTPLTALRLMTDRLPHEARERGNAGETRRADAIAGHVRRFTDVVDRMLEASTMLATGVRLVLESCDLSVVVESCTARVAERARHAGTRITTDVQPAVVGQFDKARIERMFLVLLDNAIKFGHGKPIEVSLRRQGEEAELSVRDQGPGIAPERLRSLFAPFERAVPKESFGGLGLGLYIARTIAEAHRGSITATSRVDEGTTMSVRLPLALGEPASS
jgi:signal transduction histidine kinase